jgi:predicted dehydrogenase
MAEGRLDPLPLVTHRLPLDEAVRAYDIVGGAEPSLGIVLEYPLDPPPALHEVALAPRPDVGKGTVGWVGAGSFSARVLIPAFKAAGAALDGIASAGGLSASIAGREHGFARVLADGEALMHDPAIDTLVVATRHDSHARWAIRALQAGKHVFVEKPLALSLDDVDAVGAAARAAGRHLCVGFNRRMAPLTRQLQDALRGRGAPAIMITVNAGALPREHWTKDAESGGGRIVGEACHFIDLARAMAGAPITEMHVMVARSAAGEPVDDVASIQLGFANGAMAAIQYLANGNNAWPKERIEVFAGGVIAVIENWRRLRIYGAPGGSGAMPVAQDKGHRAMAAAFMLAVRGEGPAPIALDELLEVSRWSVVAGDLARAGGGLRVIDDAT